MAIKVGSLLIDIATNTAHIKRDFDKVQRNLNSFTQKTKRIFGSLAVSIGAAFSVRAMYQFIAGTVNLVDSIEDASYAAGVSMRQFQGLAHAAKYSGVEQGKVSAALKRLNTNLLDASYGLVDAQRNFELLEISTTDSTGKLKNASDVVYEIADKFKNMKDETLRAAIAAKLMGRGGAEFVSVLMSGSKVLEEVTERLERLGGIITDEMAAKINIVNQNFVDMGAALQGIKFQILEGMSDDLLTLTSAMVKFSKEGEAFVIVGHQIGQAFIAMAKGVLFYVGMAELVAETTKELSTWGGGKEAGFLGGLFPGLSDQAPKAKGKTLTEVMQDVIDKYAWMMEELEKPIKISPIIIPKGIGATPEELATQAQALKKSIDNLINSLEFEYQMLAKTNKEQVAYNALKRSGIKFDYETGEILDKNNQARAEEIISMAKRNYEAKEFIEAIKAIKAETAGLQDQVGTWEQVWAGAKSGLERYLEEMGSLGDAMEDVVINGIHEMEDALVKFCRTGKMNFSDMVDSMITDITRLIIRQQIIAPIMGGLGIGGAGAGAGGGTTMPIRARAIGGREEVIEADRVIMPDAKADMPDGIFYAPRARIITGTETLGGPGMLGGPGGVPGGAYGEFAPIVGEGTLTGPGAIEAGDVGASMEKVSGDILKNVGDWLNERLEFEKWEFGKVAEQWATTLGNTLDEHLGDPLRDIAEGKANLEDIIQTLLLGPDVLAGAVEGAVGKENIAKAGGWLDENIGDPLRDITTGKGNLEDVVKIAAAPINAVSDAIESVGKTIGGWFGFHEGGIVGMHGRPRRLHAGLRQNEYPAILEQGEEVIPKSDVGKGLTISVPITIGERNPRLASELRAEIEATVLSVMRRHT